MRSLFLKFFLSFLLIIVLFILLGVVLAALRDREFPPLAHQHFARQAIGEYGRGAIQAYRTGGEEQLADFTARLRAETGLRLILFDETGRPFPGQRVSRRTWQMARRALDSDEVVLPSEGPANWVASPLRSDREEIYVVAVGLPYRPAPGHVLRGLGHGALGWQLLVLLGLAALVCFWLARSLTAPISRLRRATRRFAAGDLATRVAGEIRGRHELAALGADFDEMATRIETLVASQQRLLRDISHELRSPLARLGVALELVRQAGDERERHKALTRIAREAERMNELIGQLLRLTRLEGAESELQQHPFDLSRLLRRLVQDADFEARTRGCAVTYAGPEALSIWGQEELLARALENVIRNAVKYTGDGTLVKVALNTSPEQLQVSIADQGPGCRRRPWRSCSSRFTGWRTPAIGRAAGPASAWPSPSGRSDCMGERFAPGTVPAADCSSRSVGRAAVKRERPGTNANK